MEWSWRSIFGIRLSADGIAVCSCLAPVVPHWALGFIRRRVVALPSTCFDKRPEMNNKEMKWKEKKERERERTHRTKGRKHYSYTDKYRLKRQHGTTSTVYYLALLLLHTTCARLYTINSTRCNFQLHFLEPVGG